MTALLDRATAALAEHAGATVEQVDAVEDRRGAVYARIGDYAIYVGPEGGTVSSQAGMPGSLTTGIAHMSGRSRREMLDALDRADSCAERLDETRLALQALGLDVTPIADSSILEISYRGAALGRAFGTDTGTTISGYRLR